MKLCPKCGEYKSLDNFAKALKRKGGVNSWCKSCVNAYNKQLYRESKDRRNQIASSKIKNLARNRQIIYDYLSTHPCIDCGESNIIVLDFDHVRGEKLFQVSLAAHQLKSIEVLLCEIAKCDIRCANCHRRKTAKETNSWRLAPKAHVG